MGTGTTTPTLKNQNSEAFNPVCLDGIDFVEFASAEPEKLRQLFLEFGFSRTHQHKTKKIDLYRQNDITFLINMEPKSFAWHFSAQHGPSACSMGWRTTTPAGEAKSIAQSRGATPAVNGDLSKNASPLPAIMGIGDSLIYFIDDYQSPHRFENLGFVAHPSPDRTPTKGFDVIDHLTNNVHKGTMGAWSDFYKKVFGFTEIRYFDIKGAKTGLQSFALRSPCGKFCIPINEADEKKSQINEYLDEYKGPGIQHIAFSTSNIISSLEKMQNTSVRMLDIDNEYYDTVFDRVPHVAEDRAKIRDLKILVDGDSEGYLLQIFTQNLIGPIFIEVIQRKNNNTFGEGNFGALFKAIEKDQMRRGVL